MEINTDFTRSVTAVVFRDDKVDIRAFINGYELVAAFVVIHGKTCGVLEFHALCEGGHAVFCRGGIVSSGICRGLFATGCH